MENTALSLATVNKPDTQFLNDVAAGLSHKNKYLLPKYFYDKRGSDYFDQICKLDEYYPYRTEISLLPQIAKELNPLLQEEFAIVEFGAGSLQKIQPLLNSIPTITRFIPIDISGKHLQNCCDSLASMYPNLTISPVVGDFTRPLLISHGSVRRLGFFPGSTIGNFSPLEAQHFLANAKKTLGKNGLMLIGVDTKKSPEILHRAYNDSRGVTGKFNLNILHRINRELNGTIDISAFEHYAYYNPLKGCIEMVLVSSRDQYATIDDTEYYFAESECIHTESSYKYTPTEFRELVHKAGWQVDRFWFAENKLFSVYLLRDRG